MKRACLEIQAVISKNTPYAPYTAGVETSSKDASFILLYAYNHYSNVL